jgi:hypothetical protein
MLLWPSVRCKHWDISKKLFVSDCDIQETRNIKKKPKKFLAPGYELEKMAKIDKKPANRNFGEKIIFELYNISICSRSNFRRRYRISQLESSKSKI